MSETFELQIRFVEEKQVAVQTKNRVLKWLQQQKVTNLVESLIDGIHDPLGPESEASTVSGADSAALGWGFDTVDAAPIAVYDMDEKFLDRLSVRLNRAFGDAVVFARARLSDESWSQAWDDSTEVIETKHFVVLESGGAPSRPAVIPLLIHPGEAFGSGRHATTQVALEMLEKIYLGSQQEDLDSHSTLHMPQKSRMLDVGTGSGILLVAGARIGFTDLIGTEIDQSVIDEAQANLALNKVHAQLLLTAKPPQDGTLYDLVAANILAPVLHDLMPIFVQNMAKDGLLLLAGFVAKEEAGIIERASQHGLTLAMRGECRGWVGLVLQSRNNI